VIAAFLALSTRSSGVIPRLRDSLPRRLRLDLEDPEEVILGQPDADRVPPIFERYRRVDLSPQQRERSSLLPEFMRNPGQVLQLRSPRKTQCR
jgi:hypothetical protein